jgi:spermidine synthase
MGEEHGRSWLQRLLARMRGEAPPDGGDGDMARPFVRRGWRYTSLQFNQADAQSRMLRFQPDRLLIDYTRTMMGALLLNPRPARIGVIGLGGGSQVKFCHRHLPYSRIEVVENNPGVIALRRRFKVPPDDARLRVVLGDGARWVREHTGAFDLLLVDGYDEGGIPAVLSTQRYYEDCRDALAPNGVLASNLYCADADRHVNRLRRAFGDRVVVVEELQQSNRVAFAWVGDPLPRGPVDVRAALGQLSPKAREQLDDVFRRVARAFARTGVPRSG